MKDKKYRVLTADDEYWCRENIRNLISWEDYAIEFLEPAEDGEEVLERIPQEKPDILLTDINMPFMDGLELLKRIKEEYPELITVAISGYDDFNKVKGVFMSGGTDYLLKPVGREELVSVLKKSLEILEQREAEKNRGEKEILSHKISSFLEDREYSALLSGKLYQRDSGSKHVSSTVSFSEVVTVLVKFYDITEIAAQFGHDILQMSWAIKSGLRESFSGDGKQIIFNNCSKMSEFLISGTADSAALRVFAEEIKVKFPIEKYGPVSVVIHDQTSSLDDIGTVYRELISVLVTRPFCRKHCVLYCRERANEIQAVWKWNVPRRFEEELYHLLITGQTAKAQTLILHTSDFRHCRENGWSYLDVKQYVGRVTGLLFRYAQELGPDKISNAEEIMDNIDYYMKCLDAEAMFSSLEILLENLQETEDGKYPDSAALQVSQIYGYIKKSYYENITLASLASEFHMDASYLSRVFRQKYGETIIAFLTRMRMEQAILLMEDEDRKLETISFLVGYDDYNYFSRVFRKKLGVSPSEYRTRYFGKTDKNVQVNP